MTIPKMSANKKVVKKNIKRTKKVTTEWDMEMFEREARQRSAWGGYVQTMGIVRAEKEENEYQNAKHQKNDSKIKEIEENRRARQNLLYIG